MKSEPTRLSETEKYISEPLASENVITSVKKTSYHTPTLNNPCQGMDVIINVACSSLHFLVNEGLKGVIVIARVAPDNHVRISPGVSKFASFSIRFVCINQVTLRKG
jgi:hypothetical protein